MNQKLIENFQILVDYYKNLKDSGDPNDKFRKSAYENAIISIRNLPYEITSINDVKGIRGIGESIREKIDSFLKTGKIPLVESIKQEKHITTGYEIFEKVWGIGPVKAQELYSQGFRTIKDLKNNLGLLTKQQKIGVKYYEDLLADLTREKITTFRIILKICLDKHFGKNSYRMEIAGSYRRRKPRSSDVDLLISSNDFNLQELVNFLEECGIIKDVLAVNIEKFMGIANCPSNLWKNFRLDIEFVPEKEWVFGLLYFTGGKSFNKHIRSIANQKGYTLNQHGLFSQSTEKPVKNLNTEEDVMNFLGMQYVFPSERL